ncbi:glutamate-rich protein 6B isoform X3 [Eleutherodactylus coqui]|uniref:glutamate-rich protein 6B isoform X3 n=1 Tax=Eleutherodactylus coqui TaxID=57060 RepID=UPI003462CBBC
MDKRIMIEAVRQYPALWDTRCSAYRRRLGKDLLWRAVSRETFSHSWRAWSEETKQTKIRSVMTKWRSIRDAHQRSLRRSLEEGSRAPGYKYSSALRFLLPSMQLPRGSSNVGGWTSEDDFVSASSDETSSSSRARQDPLSERQTQRPPGSLGSDSQRRSPRRHPPPRRSRTPRRVSVSPPRGDDSDRPRRPPQRSPNRRLPLRSPVLIPPRDSSGRPPTAPPRHQSRSSSRDTVRSPHRDSGRRSRQNPPRRTPRRGQRNPPPATPEHRRSQQPSPFLPGDIERAALQYLRSRADEDWADAFGRSIAWPLRQVPTRLQGMVRAAMETVLEAALLESPDMEVFWFLDHWRLHGRGRHPERAVFEDRLQHTRGMSRVLRAAQGDYFTPPPVGDSRGGSSPEQASPARMGGPHLQPPPEVPSADPASQPQCSLPLQEPVWLPEDDVSPGEGPSRPNPSPPPAEFQWPAAEDLGVPYEDLATPSEDLATPAEDVGPPAPPTSHSRRPRASPSEEERPVSSAGTPRRRGRPPRSGRASSQGRLKKGCFK